MGVVLTIGALAVSGAVALVAGVCVQFGSGFGLMAAGAVLVAAAALLRKVA